MELIALAVLAIAVAAFLITHRRRAAGGAAAHGRRRQALSTAEALGMIPVLRERRAHWPEILQTLNPGNDPRVAAQLHRIRGPHMFDPHTALGVIETGCREVHPMSHVHEGLAAAVASMNKVVEFGR